MQIDEDNTPTSRDHDFVNKFTIKNVRPCLQIPPGMGRMWVMLLLPMAMTMMMLKMVMGFVCRLL